MLEPGKNKNKKMNRRTIFSLKTMKTAGRVVAGRLFSNHRCAKGRGMMARIKNGDLCAADIIKKSHEENSQIVWCLNSDLHLKNKYAIRLKLLFSPFFTITFLLNYIINNIY